MDPISVSASVTTLLQTASMTLKYIYDIKYSTRERSELAQEVISLLLVLQRLNDRLEGASEDESWFQASKLLIAPKGPLTLLNKTLQDLKVKLLPETGLKKLGQKLTWPITRVEFDRNLAQIERLKSQIDMVLREDHLQISKQILELSHETSKTMQSILDAKLLEKIAVWLSPLNFHAHQEFIFHQATASTGEWFLKCRQFIEWTGGSPSMLYCPGMPGAGKTVMSSIVINHLQKSFSQQDIPVLFLYLNHRDAIDHTLQNLIGSLIRQLLQRNVYFSLPDKLRALWEEHRTRETRPSLDQFINILREQLSVFEKSFIIVDALDECRDEGTRKNLLNVLSDLREVESRPMVTSRPLGTELDTNYIFCDGCNEPDLLHYHHCFICDESDFDLCEKCLKEGKTCYNRSHSLYKLTGKRSVVIQAPTSDLHNYLKQRLVTESRLAEICRNYPNIQAKITEKAIEAADGMFLFLKLLIDSLKTKHTPKAITKALDTMPATLNGLYDDTMKRVEQQGEDDANFAKTILKWVIWSKRALSVEELLHALAVSSEDTDFDGAEVTHESVLFMITRGLVVMDHQNRVRLVHYTTYNYFMENKEKWFPNDGLEITRTILTYLNFRAFSEPCQGINEDELLDERIQNYPFLRYASKYWGNHVHEYYNHQPDIRNAALSYLRSPKRLASSIQAGWWLGSSWDAIKGINSLHVCAIFGLDGIIGDIISDGLDIDSQDSLQGSTPLIYACRRGHLDAVKEFVKLGASTNLRNEWGDTAFVSAILANHIDIVAFLLKGKNLAINVTYPYRYGQTALMMAIAMEFYDIMVLLLQQPGIQIDVPDSKGGSALHYAAMASEPKYIKTLSSHPNFDPNVTIYSTPYMTPLMLAANNGKSKNVEMLLESNADPDIRDEGGRVAIRQAISGGHISTVKTLLGHNVDINVIDREGMTLLHSSCINGHIKITELLLDAGLDVNGRGESGETCLHYIARSSRSDIGTLLLRKGADISIVDKYGRTALEKARQYGNFEFAHILLGEKHLPDKLADTMKDELSKLPLWTLARLGLTQEVRNYIKQGGDLCVEDPDNSNNALHQALWSGHLDVVEILLKAGMDANSPNKYDYTALHICALTGNEEATKHLLSYDVGLNDKTISGQTALTIASESKNFRVAVLLIESGVTIEPDNCSTVELLFTAIKLGKVEAVKRLIAKGINTRSVGRDGLTPFEIAKSLGHKEIVKVLRMHNPLLIRTKSRS